MGIEEFWNKDFLKWFKENTPKEGLSRNTTFTKQFVYDSYVQGRIDELELYKKLSEKLTQAKEMIRWFVVYEKGEGIITNFNNFLEQAENFLEE